MFRYMRQLAGESLIYGLSGVVARFISFLLVPIYTRLFAPEDYGVISLVSTTMALVSIFVVLALDSAAGRWYWDTENVVDRKSTLASWAWCQIGVSLLFATLIIASADRLAQLIVGRADAGLYFRLAAGALPLSALGAVVTNWLRFQRRAWATVTFSLSTSLLNIGLTLLLAVGLRWRLTGVYAAQLLTAVASAALAVLFLKDWISPRHFHLARLRKMLGYAMPLIPSAIAYWIINVSDRYFVQHYQTTDEVGLYQVANSIAMVIALVTSAFQQAWGPFAMSIHLRDEARQVYANAFLAYVCLGCVVGTGLALLAPEAIRLVATARYAGASQIVGYLVFSNIMLGLYYIAAIGPSLARRTRPVSEAFLIAAALNTAMNFWLVPGLGKQGAAISTLVSFTVMPIYLFARGQRLYAIPYRFGPAAGMFVLSGALIWLARAWQPPDLWWGVAGKLALLSLFAPAVLLLRIVSVSQVRRVLHSRWPSRRVA